MNRLTAAFVILAVTLGLGFSGYFYIDRSALTMIEQLEADRTMTVEAGTADENRAKNKRQPVTVSYAVTHM